MLNTTNSTSVEPRQTTPHRGCVIVPGHDMSAIHAAESLFGLPLGEPKQLTC